MQWQRERATHHRHECHAKVLTDLIFKSAVMAPGLVLRGTGGSLLHREASPLIGATATQIAEAVPSPGNLPPPAKRP